jgi:hypothetical protein
VWKFRCRVYDAMGNSSVEAGDSRIGRDGTYRTHKTSHKLREYYKAVHNPPDENLRYEYTQFLNTSGKWQINIDNRRVGGNCQALQVQGRRE